MDEGYPSMDMPLQLNNSIRAGGMALVASMDVIKDEGLVLQWGYQETKDLIAFRAELKKDFANTALNKVLWELVSNKMREKGHPRNAEQCKCKWMNMVARYEDKTLEPFFYEQLHVLFTEHTKSKDKTPLNQKTVSKSKKKSRKQLAGDRSSEESSDAEGEESGDERSLKGRKRKIDKERHRVTAEKCRANTMQEVLEDFFERQQRNELQWREAMERREQERRLHEQEWREAMEKLEKERLMREQLWREREEQRREREEARAEKRDSLFTALLARLAREEL